MTHDDVLKEYMNEHYTHARAHETLRAQITAILAAASFALIGFGLAKEVHGTVVLAIACFVIMLAALNHQLNRLHTNRVDAHVAAAAFVRKDLEKRHWKAEDKAIKTDDARAEFDKMKRGSLSDTWNFISWIIGVSGGLLFIYGVFLIYPCR